MNKDLSFGPDDRRENIRSIDRAMSDPHDMVK
nr:hypothetical protein [Metabacillus idriensis]